MTPQEWGDSMPTRTVVRDPQGVAAKIARFRAENVCLVSDFDATLTSYMYGEEKGWSSHGIVERSDKLSDAYRKRARELFNKYYPIEVDCAIPHDEKYAHMEQWWDEAHRLITQEKLRQSDISGMVKGACMALRKRTRELFNVLHGEKIPVLVFSAGLGDIVTEYLSQNLDGSAMEDVHVISNMMRFDETGTCVGFKTKNIHVLNKGQVPLGDYPWADSTKSRKQIILLGDHIGDIHMADEYDRNNVLAFGFLNTKVEESLEQYAAVYDVVVLDDGGMDVVLEAVKGFIGQRNGSSN